MSNIFGGPKLPAVPQAKAAPKVEDPEVQAAAARERKLQRLRRGRQSTILTGLGEQTSPGQAKVKLGQ